MPISRRSASGTSPRQIWWWEVSSLVVSSSRGRNGRPAWFIEMPLDTTVWFPRSAVPISLENLLSAYSRRPIPVSMEKLPIISRALWASFGTRLCPMIFWSRFWLPYLSSKAAIRLWPNCLSPISAISRISLPLVFLEVSTRLQLSKYVFISTYTNTYTYQKHAAYALML